MDDRMERGRQVATSLFAEGGVRLPAPPEIARDWGRFTLSTAMGDVWARPGLGLRERGLVTIAALTALGWSHELRLHLQAARKLGWSRAELCEAIWHLAIYAGFPAAVEGMRAAQEVFAQEESLEAGGDVAAE